jgi:hypothetical protein
MKPISFSVGRVLASVGAGLAGAVFVPDLRLDVPVRYFLCSLNPVSLPVERPS